MTNQLTRIQALRYALQSSATDFSSTPGTLYPIEATDALASFLPRSRETIRRNVRTLDGTKVADVYGKQEIGAVTVPVNLRGINSNTGGAVTDWEAKQEIGLLLKSMFGAAAAATSSTAPTVAASGHTPGSGVLEVVGTNTVAGQVIAFATSDGIEFGLIASGAGTTTLTLAHPYNGTPTTGATVYRLAKYLVDDDLVHHQHAFFSVEGDAWRRDYPGCAPQSLTIDIPAADLVTATLTFMPTSWADVAEANTAYAAPTAGEHIFGGGSRLIWEGALYYAKAIKITVDNGLAMRELTGSNGVLGGVCAAGDRGKTFVIEAEVYADSAQAPYGIDDAKAMLVKGAGADAGDVNRSGEIAVFCGNQVGALLYAYCGDATYTVETVDSNGYLVHRIRAEGVGATPGVLAVG